ncbi:MAG: epoxyqueuosine reductase QueH [Desulfocapsa sp.]|nr:epoxyqueuosine reductase QueH [Desulfocapsa sp.]MBN4052924.1 epoxyqueuosine reductase QueH [bacterium AH-315-K15]
MKLLLHVCCAPCSTYTLGKLREQNIDVSGYFYNPNIHPYREFRKRLATLREFAAVQDFPLEIVSEYGLTEYLRKVVFHEKLRCMICYDMRLEKTALQALKSGADAFSSTLLYSKYQNHETITKIGKQVADKYGVEFYYDDFREGWQEGIDKAIEMDLYRQPYCGCIYSEQERYDKKLQKKLRNERILEKAASADA